MTEEDKQRMIAEMMRRGMSPGMEGQMQQFAQAPAGQPNDYSTVPIEMMADRSQQILGKRKDKEGPKEPEHPYTDPKSSPGSMAGSTPEEEMALESAVMRNPKVEMPAAVVEAMKKRWWEF